MNPKKKILIFHLIGFAFLAFTGVLDVIDAFHLQYSGKYYFYSFTIFGIIGLGILLNYAFIERLIYLIKERNIFFQQLGTANDKLNELRSLSELGKSSSIINHEIKNYTFSIAALAKGVQISGEIDEKTKKKMNQIIETVTNLTEYTQGVLDFSKSKIKEDWEPVDIPMVINNCIDRTFPDKKDSFQLKYPDSATLVLGTQRKLERLFINCFKNSFEAGAECITIEISSLENNIDITIGDNGEGCTEEQLEKLFEPFYTTKSGQKGTGLGMAIIKSIVDNYGGEISAFSKNISDTEDHGLVLRISLPTYNNQ